MADNSISVVICDDDEGMRLIERKMIEKNQGFRIVGEGHDGNELLQLVEELHPQVVFLDVEMPGKTGVECGKIIQDIDPSIILIFATAHDQYMGDAFQVYAFDYLIKPFKVERVMQTLTRVKERLHRENEVPLPELPKKQTKIASQRMLIKGKGSTSFVTMSDILLIQREGRTTVIYTHLNRYETADTLSETMEKLDPEVFFRCHKCYIININEISQILPYGRWTYIVKLNGTDQDALITHDKYEELQNMFQ